MTGGKLVSVIIPVYNVEKFLVKCIDSVRAQTYKRLEIILVDDGSADRSSVLCDCFSVIDQRIQVIHKENGGLSSARNAGLDMASGEYIYFLDSDDYIEPQLIEKTVETIEQTDSDWCGFRAVKEDVEGRMLYQITFQEGIYRVKNEEERVKFLLGTFLNYKIGWEACFHVYKRSIIEKNNLRFVSERLVYAEDLLFSFCYLLNINSAVILPESFYHYVERKDSLMGKNKERYILPQVHRLFGQMYRAMCESGKKTILEYGSLFYLFLMEWHIRPYIENYGIEWIKEKLSEISWGEYIKKDYFLHQYQKDIKKLGAVCGVISVVLPVEIGEVVRIEQYLKTILNQSFQRFELVLVCKEGCRIGNDDFRIRYIYTENINIETVFGLGFEKGVGEFLYFADPDAVLNLNFLWQLSDAMKYNQCDTGILSGAIDSSKVYGTETLHERKAIRTLLKKTGINRSQIIFRRDLLQKSGLCHLAHLENYEENMILSGKVIFLKR